MRSALFRLVFALLCASPLDAQIVAPSPAERDSLFGTLRVQLADPTLSSVMRLSLPVVILEGTTDNTVAKAGVGLQTPSWGVRLTAQAPIRKGASSTSFANLDGLRASSTAGVGVTWMRWNPRIDLERAGRVCLDAGINPETEACAKDALDEEKAAAYCTKQRAVRDAPVCNEKAVVKRWRRQFDAAVDYGVRVVLSGGIEAGRQVFRFADASTLADSQEELHPRSFEFGIGTYKPGGLLSGLWGLSYKNQRSYEAAEEMDLCVPFGAADALRCRSLVVGAPAEQRRSIVTGEHRRFVSSAFAVNPRLHYDFEKSDFAVEVPVYFLRNVDGGLTGGLALGWRSDVDELIAQVFVGPVLGVLSR